MEKQKHKFKQNQRVRLKSDGQDAVYASACAGSEGWVRGRQIENLGYPMVYIEWDKEHWTYNGESDRWAFEAHFDPVEVEMSEGQEDNGLADALIQTINAWKEQGGSTKVPVIEEPDGEAQPEEEELEGFEIVSEEEYAEAVDRAAKVASQADSFIMIAVNRREVEGFPVMEPMAANCYQSPEGGLLCEMQLGEYSSYSLRLLAAQEIRRILEKREAKDDGRQTSEDS